MAVEAASVPASNNTLMGLNTPPIYEYYWRIARDITWRSPLTGPEARASSPALKGVSGADEGVGRVLDRLPRDVAVTREIVLLVLLVVALEPHPLRVALRREDVSGDAIEEEAVMTHDDHAAGELEQRLDR